MGKKNNSNHTFVDGYFSGNQVNQNPIGVFKKVQSQPVKDVNRRVDTTKGAETIPDVAGFNQGYTMQKYDPNSDSNKDQNLPQENEFNKLSKNKDSEPQNKSANENLDNTKETRTRRKSSTLDMFNDPADFMQQVEESLENVPEQHSNDNTSDSSPASKKESPPRISLKSKLSVKKGSVPYKPSNYQPTYYSPSPKRYSHAQGLPGGQMAEKDLFPPSFINSNFENQNYLPTESPTLKLTKTHSANPGPYPPIVQRSYSFKYQDPSRLQGYGGGGGQGHPQMIPQAMMANQDSLCGSPGVYAQTPIHYNQFERE